MEKIRIEKNENPVESKIISPKELMDIIYKGESIPQDNRFLSIDNGGVFKYFDPRDLFDNIENKVYSIIKNDKEIAALGELEKNPYSQDTYWIKFLSVDQIYQGNGYASILAEEIFKFAKNNNISLESSSYTTEGQEKIKDVFKRLAEKFMVNFIDSDKSI